MKSEISRDSHDPEKKYSGVYQQQGRMLTDADWNELTDIVKDRLDDALKDVVGGGTPRGDHKLRIGKNGGKWEIVPGKVYVDGIPARVAGATNVAYLGQPDFPSAPKVKGEGCFYVDVWERTVTSLEDGHLLDAGLHGADTCTRTQTMCQVKWCPQGVVPENGSANPGKGNAPLSVKLKEDATVKDNCDPCAKEMAVDASTGDYLFRVEVHDVKGPADAPTEITLKWSSENGAIQCGFGVEPAGFQGNEWAYEFFNGTSERHLGVHLVGGFTPVRDALHASYPTSAPKDFPFVRRWDGFVTLVKGGNGWAFAKSGAAIAGSYKGEALSDAATDPAGKTGHVSCASSTFTATLDELVLTLNLDGNFVAGDYWLADVRSRRVADYLGSSDAGKGLYFLGYAGTGGKPQGVGPHGIEHHYLRLADVDTNGNLQSNPEADRKYAFPPLTEMTRMFHVGGDGQEAMPGQALPQSLEVGVANGQWLVQGAKVLFALDGGGGGSLAPVNDGVTDANGIARCKWTLGPDGSQRVIASLVDPEKSESLKHPPLYFNASLNEASNVSFDSGKACANTPSVKSLIGSLDFDGKAPVTVQDVLDTLLCGLKAEHIPFTDKCANGLYPDTVKTVADALKTLCSLDSAHVAHDPVCNYLKQANVTTVEQAIEALCKRPSGGIDCATLLKLFGRGVVCGVVPAFSPPKRAGNSLRRVGNSLQVNISLSTSPGTVLDGRGCIQVLEKGLNLSTQVNGYHWAFTGSNFPELLKDLSRLSNSPVTKKLLTGAKVNAVFKNIKTQVFPDMPSIQKWLSGELQLPLQIVRQVYNIVIKYAVRQPLELKFLLVLAVPQGGTPVLELREQTQMVISGLVSSFPHMMVRNAAGAAGGMQLVDKSVIATADANKIQDAAWKTYQDDFACPKPREDGSIFLGTVGVYGDKTWICPDNREQILSVGHLGTMHFKPQPVYDTIAKIYRGQ